MKRQISIIISMVLVSSTYSRSEIQYPKQLKVNHIDTYFGVEVNDPTVGSKMILQLLLLPG